LRRRKALCALIGAFREITILRSNGRTFLVTLIGGSSCGDFEMRVKLAILATAALCLVAASSARAAEPTAAGLWDAVDDESGKSQGWFLVTDRGGVYDGIIAKMVLQPGEDPNAPCEACPDDRKGMPWLGLPLIRGMVRHGMRYEGGTILDPRDGNIYHATMTLSPDSQTLVVRGYLGFELLGRNQYWHRLPETAFNELDPSINPKRPAKMPARKAERPARTTSSVR
jgi:uncharacterized protein (DUF2147 family)